MPDSQKQPQDPKETEGQDEHRLLGKFMHAAEHAAAIWGPASHGDTEAPVVHKHDAFEQASEDDLRGFEVATDSEGHHYAVRKDEASGPERGRGPRTKRR